MPFSNNLFYMILHGRRQTRRRCIMVGSSSPTTSPMILLLVNSLSDPYSILFDVASGHDDHSGELPLFVGFVVD